MKAGRKLEVEDATVTVCKILPMEGMAVDQTMMPDYPGFAEKKSCRDWDPGVAITLSRIRPKDEEYWDKYKGAPKAFITLADGQKLWPNRFGSLTGIRWPLEPGIQQKN